MPFEGRQRAALFDRCWSIYLSLTNAFNVPESFHVEFPVVVESALVSGALHVTVPVGADMMLSLREEYVIDRQRLTINRYSYNLWMLVIIISSARIICLFTEPTTANVCDASATSYS